MQIKIDANIKDAIRNLDDRMRRQVPFATARALTVTAKGVKEALSKEVGRVFDRPTPFIRNSAFSTSATKDKLEAVAGIRDAGGRVPPAKYLQQHLTAGDRGNKPMEKAMRAAGILPTGWLAVPSSDGVKKDAYGNVSKATVSRILRELQGGGRRQEKGATYRLFIVRPGQADRRARHLAPGIWSVSRIGDQSITKPVFFFVNRATYRKVIDLPALAIDVVRRDFDRNFAAAFEAAMRAAR